MEGKEKKAKRRGERVEGGGGKFWQRCVLGEQKEGKNEKGRDWSEKIIEAALPPAAGGL